MKRYTNEIPVALRAHYKDVVFGGTRFSGKVKKIGHTMYGLSGWLRKTRLQKPLKESGRLRNVHIMYRGGLFMSGPGELGEPTL